MMYASDHTSSYAAGFSWFFFAYYFTEACGRVLR